MMDCANVYFFPPFFFYVFRRKVIHLLFQKLVITPHWLVYIYTGTHSQSLRGTGYFDTSINDSPLLYDFYLRNPDSPENKKDGRVQLVTT